MPSPVRSLFVAFQFAALAAFLIFGASLTVVPVLASPIPMPMPTLVDFVTPRSLNSSEPTSADESKPLDRRDLDLSSILPGLAKRDINTFVGDIQALNTYYGVMNQHASNFRTSF